MGEPVEAIGGLSQPSLPKKIPPTEGRAPFLCKLGWSREEPLDRPQVQNRDPGVREGWRMKANTFDRNLEYIVPR